MLRFHSIAEPLSVWETKTRRTPRSGLSNRERRSPLRRENDNLPFFSFKLFFLYRQLGDRLKIAFAFFLEKFLECVFFADLTVVHRHDDTRFKRDREFMRIRRVERSLAAYRQKKDVDIVELFFRLVRQLRIERAQMAERHSCERNKIDRIGARFPVVVRRRSKAANDHIIDLELE